MSQVISFLLDNGPSTLDELPAQPSHADRENEVSAVKWRLGGHGAIKCKGGHNAKFVYYLRDKHSKREVVEAWLSVNNQILEYNEKQAIYNALTDKADRSWRDALSGVWESRGWPKSHGNTNPQDNSGGTCPLCGQAYESNFPTHRRTECDA